MQNNYLSPKEIYNYVENVGIDKTSKKAYQTLFLGILAGMFIAMGAYAAGIASHSIENYGLAKLVAGIVFPVGLMMVLVCGAELFTGNSLLSIAFFEGKITLPSMLKNWVLVYVGNLIGAVTIVLMLYFSGVLDTNGGMFGAYAIKVAAGKTSIDFGQALISGTLCNIIVCFCVWGSYAAKDVTGKVLMGFFPIMAFVIAGFEHSVANMYYLTLGLLAKGDSTYVELGHFTAEKLENLNIGGIIGNLIPVTLGNIIGGSIVVAGLYWVVFKKSNKEKAAYKKVS